MPNADINIILWIVLSVLFLAGLTAGYRQMLHFGNLTKGKVIAALTFIVLVVTSANLAHWFQLISTERAAQFTMGLYMICAGFFFGSGVKIMRKRSKAGRIDYMFRSFTTDILPSLLAVGIVAFGIYRTSLLTGSVITGVRVTSGLSLIMFGFYGWTLNVVPEFRGEGIILLDRFIPWSTVISYEWRTEETLTIDYQLKNEKISDFTTSVPPEDQLSVERLLNRKIEEHKPDTELELPRVEQ